MEGILNGCSPFQAGSAGELMHSIHSDWDDSAPRQARTARTLRRQALLAERQTAGESNESGGEN